LGQVSQVTVGDRPRVKAFQKKPEKECVLGPTAG